MSWLKRIGEWLWHWFWKWESTECMEKPKVDEKAGENIFMLRSEYVADIVLLSDDTIHVKWVDGCPYNLNRSYCIQENFFMYRTKDKKIILPYNMTGRSVMQLPKFLSFNEINNRLLSMFREGKDRYHWCVYCKHSGNDERCNICMDLDSRERPLWESKNED